jgi:small-conductance mechanosensitive channel
VKIRTVARASLLTSLLLASYLPISAASSPTPTPAQEPTPYPTSSIVDEADRTAAEITKIHSEVTDDATPELRKFLPKLKANINARVAETDLILHGDARIGELQSLTTRWIILRDDIALRTRLLNDELAELDANSTRLAQLTATWNATSTAASGNGTPDDILNRIRNTRRQLSTETATLASKRTTLLELQSKLADQNNRIASELTAVQLARDHAFTGLLLRDSPPLWKFSSLSRSVRSTQIRENNAPFFQLRESSNYLFQQRGLITLHLFLWIVLVLLFRSAQRKVSKWVKTDPALEGSTTIFHIPLATASLLALWLGFPLYSGAPPLLTAMLGTALLAPLMVVVGRLIEPPLKPVVWTLAVFCLTSQIREAATPFPLAGRVIYLAETLGGVALAVWILRRSHFAVAPQNSLLRKVAVAGARAGLLFFGCASVANILGYVNLASFAGAVGLQSAYLGVLLYAVCHIAEGFLTFALNVPPLSLLSMVRHHKALLEHRIAKCFRLLAFLVWTVFTLEKLSLLNPVVATLAAFLTTPIFGPVSLGGVLTFLLTVWASFLISEFIRFALEEDVYRRLSLKPGLPFAISTFIHYAILLLGFYLAAAALIGDAGKFTILAGAFGVGVGFGLQNIVNNFVSGLIVLFERPVKIGDYVQIGTSTGAVRKIGIRATIIRTDDGSEVIIPNANLIANPVINWTLTDQHRRLEIDVATAAGVEPRRVIALLEETAAAQSTICKTPPPQAVLAKFTPTVLSFELRIWTLEISNFDRLRSDLTIAISETMAKNNIAPA